MTLLLVIAGIDLSVGLMLALSEAMLGGGARPGGRLSLPILLPLDGAVGALPDC